MKAMRIDFLKPQGQPTAGWLVLATGLTVLGLASWQYLGHLQRQDAIKQAQQQQLRLQAEQERQRLAALPAPAPDYLEDKRWRHAARELTLPWISTWRALEQAAKPPVFLLGFKSDPVSGRLQLDAEAPGFDAALDFVSALQGLPALAQTQMASHEELPDPQGRPLTRFSVNTQWVLTP